MTLIAAMDCGDSIVMGSDSLVTYDGWREVRRKLWIPDGRPLVFGFTGDEGIGFLFRDWLLGYEWPADVSWPAFSKEAASVLGGLNATRKAMGQRAGHGVTGNDLAGLLIAGAVGGRLDVYELDTIGDAQSVKHPALAVYTSFMTDGRTRSVETMRKVMAPVVEHAAGLQGPLQMVQVDATKATMLTASLDAR